MKTSRRLRSCVKDLQLNLVLASGGGSQVAVMTSAKLQTSFSITSTPTTVRTKMPAKNHPQAELTTPRAAPGSSPLSCRGLSDDYWPSALPDTMLDYRMRSPWKIKRPAAAWHFAS